MKAVTGELLLCKKQSGNSVNKRGKRNRPINIRDRTKKNKVYITEYLKNNSGPSIREKQKRVVRSMGSGVMPTGFESLPVLLVLMNSRTYLCSLCLSFLICKTGTLTVSNLWHCQN